MAGIFGTVFPNVTQNDFVKGLDQVLVFEVAKTWTDEINKAMTDAMRVFVSETTEAGKERYLLPGGGMLQARGAMGPVGAVRPDGSWDTAYPIGSFGDAVVATDVAWGYMTVGQLERHMLTVKTRYENTVRFKILQALFNNTNLTVVDDSQSGAGLGTLTCVPLANSDGTLYPPIIGSNTEAQDSHYLYPNYTAANISDTNNPCITVRRELTEHFGESTGGDAVVMLIGDYEEREKIAALSNFVEVQDRFIKPGGLNDVPQGFEGIPGTVIGRCDGVWISVWNYIPQNYTITMYMGGDGRVPAPLKYRVDPAKTGLPRGLALVTPNSSAEPTQLVGTEWRWRGGFGVGNRLGAVVLQFGNGGAYAVPSGYAY